MGGFDRDRARDALAIPDDLEIEVFVAVGKQGDVASLPEWAKARETPSGRRPPSEIVREGSFGP